VAVDRKTKKKGWPYFPGSKKSVNKEHLQALIYLNEKVTSLVPFAYCCDVFAHRWHVLQIKPPKAVKTPKPPILSGRRRRKGPMAVTAIMLGTVDAVFVNFFCFSLKFRAGVQGCGMNSIMRYLHQKCPWNSEVKRSLGYIANTLGDSFVHGIFFQKILFQIFTCGYAYIAIIMLLYCLDLSLMKLFPVFLQE
jgi:hypothetical protein